MEGDFSEYNTTIYEKKLWEMTIDKINEFITPDMDALDLGAMSGDMAKKLNFKTMVLVDTNFLSQEEIPGTMYVTCDIEGFVKHTSHKYDFVLMVRTIEHLHSPYAVLNNLYKLLNPKGKIFILYPNARSLNRILGAELGLIKTPYDLSESDIKSGHRHMYDYQFIEELEWKTGGKYEVIDNGGFLFKPLPLKEMQYYFRDDIELFVFLGTKFHPKIAAELWCLIEKI